MDHLAPPIGPEAEFRVSMLQCISGLEWKRGDDPHQLICRHLIEKLPMKWEQSDLSLFSVGFPGISRQLKEANSYIDLFCSAHSFLISLYNAVMPMGADVSVPVRTAIWMRYQREVMNLVDEYKWPHPSGNLTPDRNIVPMLQRVMDADDDIRHLGLSAETLSTPPQYMQFLSHSMAQDMMLKMFKTCYPELRTDQDILVLVEKVRPTLSDILPVYDLLLIIAEACKRISRAVEKHITDHKQEYEEAVAYLEALSHSEDVPD